MTKYWLYDFIVDSYFDRASRLIRKDAIHTANGALLGRNLYNHDAESNIVWTKDDVSDRQQNLYYDNMGQLTRVQGNMTGNWSYTYDSHNDIKTVTRDGVSHSYNYDGQRRLSSITSTLESGRSGVGLELNHGCSPESPDTHCGWPELNTTAALCGAVDENPLQI